MYKDIINNEFSKYDHDLWFLKQKNRTLYRFDNDGETLLFEEIVSVSENFKINTHISNDLFNVHFPVGLTIVDIDTNEELINTNTHEVFERLHFK